MSKLARFGCGLLLVTLLGWSSGARALDLIVDGKPRATIVVDRPEPEAPPAPPKGKPKPNAKPKAAKRATTPGDEMAAEVLADWLRKMTGAEVPVATAAPADGVAVYVGKAALKAGLTLDDGNDPTREQLRVRCDGGQVLVAGANDVSTVKAVCRLLEELGCRYLMEGELGEVYPRTPTVALKDCDLREKPGYALRQIWGSNWGGNSLWKLWNGAGGTAMAQGHAWGSYVPKDLFDAHPEYFALRGGQRVRGDWYCTSNPELRKVFADGVIRVLDTKGGNSASVSPPDGISYCECDACRAQDDPKSIEPSSGKVAVTNRYVDFLNDVARRVRAKHPDANLGFYCYADYTQAPTGGLKLEPNLVAWVAPLRYCRIHRIGSDVCASRTQLAEMIRDWGKAAPGGIGYRTYNYNLAECTVPFSLTSVWAHDIPWLKQQGAVGINLETLTCWQIYGPHLYASLRLAYAPGADVAALMDDYYAKFYGPAAAAPMKAYWQGVDDAWAKAPVHAGSFFTVHRVYTPQFIARCRGLLEDAAAATRPDEAYATRVRMHREGFENAAQYVEVLGHLAAGRGGEARDVFKRLTDRAGEQREKRWSNEYTLTYLKRFVGKAVEAAGAAATAPSRIVQALPDRWRLAYDEEDQGVAKNFAAETFDDSGWKSVQTHGDTLDGQGLEDRKTILWYRAGIDVPAAAAAAAQAKRTLLFLEVDGDATVFINGQQAGQSTKKRVPFEVDAGALKPGRNTVAVRVDHSRITELSLGGIIRPVFLVEKPAE